MSKVYEKKVRVSDQALQRSVYPDAMLSGLLQGLAMQIVRQHHSSPDSEVRGDYWAMAMWRDLRTFETVVQLVCGARFDVEDYLQHEGPRAIEMLTDEQIASFVRSSTAKQLHL